MPLVRQGSNSSTHSSLYPATGPSLAVSNGVSGEPSPRDMHADVTCSDAEPMHNLPMIDRDHTCSLPGIALQSAASLNESDLSHPTVHCRDGPGHPAPQSLRPQEVQPGCHAALGAGGQDRAGQHYAGGLRQHVHCLPQPRCGGSSGSSMEVQLAGCALGFSRRAAG